MTDVLERKFWSLHQAFRQTSRGNIIPNPSTPRNLLNITTITFDHDAMISRSSPLQTRPDGAILSR
jgi:hypothetical protein